MMRVYTHSHVDSVYGAARLSFKLPSRARAWPCHEPDANTLNASPTTPPAIAGIAIHISRDATCRRRP